MGSYIIDVTQNYYRNYHKYIFDRFNEEETKNDDLLPQKIMTYETLMKVENFEKLLSNIDTKIDEHLKEKIIDNYKSIIQNANDSFNKEIEAINRKFIDNLTNDFKKCVNENLFNKFDNLKPKIELKGTEAIKYLKIFSIPITFLSVFLIIFFTYKFISNNIIEREKRLSKFELLLNSNPQPKLGEDEYSYFIELIPSNPETQLVGRTAYHDSKIIRVPYKIKGFDYINDNPK